MAANHMRKVQGLKLSSEQRLELYALFKQATEGDCDEPKPGLIDLVGRAKWYVHGCELITVVSPQGISWKFKPIRHKSHRLFDL